MPWYLHVYHFSWLFVCLAAGYWISWWIPLAVIAAVVFYGIKY